MKKNIVAFVIGLIFAAVGYTITTNPASNVTADSDNTALTIPYRDENAQLAGMEFSSGFVPLIRTKAQFDALTPTEVGLTYLCSNCTIPYSMCVATGTAKAQFKVTHSATVGCGTNN
jgi:hypothetical protein